MYKRDTEKLYRQYINLINGIFKDQKKKFSYGSDFNNSKMLIDDDDPRAADLRSYIDEQFVKLVQEYHIHSVVDFPGYIKNMLGLRTKHTYIKGYFRYVNREIPATENPNDDELTPIQAKGHWDEYLPVENIYGFIMSLGIDLKELSELDWCIILSWSLGLTRSKDIVDNITYDDNKYTSTQITKEVAVLRKKLSGHLFKNKAHQDPINNKNMLIARSIKEKGNLKDYLTNQIVKSNSIDKQSLLDKFYEVSKINGVSFSDYEKAVDEAIDYEKNRVVYANNNKPRYE